MEKDNWQYRDRMREAMTGACVLWSPIVAPGRESERGSTPVSRTMADAPSIGKGASSDGHPWVSKGHSVD